MTSKLLSTWLVGDPVVVGGPALERFSAAVGEPPGSVPPTYPVALTWEVQNRALAPIFELPGLGLHGEQVFAYSRPVAFGQVLVPRARVVAVLPKRSGTAVTCRTELHDDVGSVCTQLFTVFQVGRFLEADGEVPTLPGDPGAAESSIEVGRHTEDIAPDQSLRYAVASGDDYAIHTDEAFARSQGLDGIILHGMCTLALAARAVVAGVADGDPARLSFLAVRFSAPVPRASRVTTRFGRSGSVGFFETHLADGTQVLTNGRYALR